MKVGEYLGAPFFIFFLLLYFIVIYIYFVKSV